MEQSKDSTNKVPPAEDTPTNDLPPPGGDTPINDVPPVEDTPTNGILTGEDTPIRPTLIDALYTSNVSKKKSAKKSSYVFIKDGIDLRKIKRTAKVIN